MFCFCNSPAATEIYTYLHTLSLHDAFPVVTVKVNWPCAVSPSGQTIVRLPERDSPAASASTGTVASSTCWPLDALRTNMRSEKPAGVGRSEEHTSELQSLMRISYAVFCLKKKKSITTYTTQCLK